MKSDYQVPSEIYDTVLDLMVAIADASMAEDPIVLASCREKLREYCEQQTAAGHGSGFLWESLADVTENPDEQIAYYEKALEFARKNGEPLQTTLVALAEGYIHRGDRTHAKILLHEVRQQAISEGDAETEAAATKLLEEIPE